MRNKNFFASATFFASAASANTAMRICTEKRRMSLRTIGSASLIFAASLMLFSGCSTFSSSQNVAGNWMKDGALALSRPVPEATLDLSSTENMFGFMPTSSVHGGRWLRIDRASKTLDLMNGRSSLASISGDGLQALKPGVYAVQHKQRSPVWYAPDGYFAARLLDTPGEGETERFRRGALGPLAIFLDEQTPLHTGPMWRKEIGGVKLAENDLEQLFGALEVGAPVEVR